jgi:ATP:ADP antiporter, AAA family
MQFSQRLSKFFNIEPGEGRLTWLLCSQYFLLGSAFNFIQTAAFTLFLLEFNAQTLPFVYLANALIIPLLTFLYLRLGSRFSFARLMSINLIFLLVMVAAFRLGLSLPNSRGVVFALPILFQILVNLGNLTIWPLAGRLFNVRQAKRLFGLVGAGMWVAIVLTGFLMPALVAWIGIPNLIVLSALSLGGALAVNIYLTRSFAGSLAAQEVPQTTSAGKTESDSIAGLLRNRYVMLIFLLIVAWWLGFFFLDNLFYDRAAAQFPDGQQLASFLGLFLAGLGILTLIGNFFLTGFFLSRFGLRTSLLLLPVLLLAATVGLAFTGTISQAVGLLFLLTTSAKLLNMSLGFSIDRSSQVILYQPLASRLRAQAQTVAEGMVQPLANGLAGIALIALNLFFASSTLPLIYGLLFIIFAWAVAAALLGRQYPAMLVRALARRRLAGGDIDVRDASSLDILRKGLQSPNAGVAIYAVNMLAEADPEGLASALPSLLDHPAPEVRREALARIERLGLVSALPLVRERFSQERDPALRGLALWTAASLGEAKAYEEVRLYLEDPEPQVRLHAVAGLLRSGGSEGSRLAGQKLLDMAGSNRGEERRLAAQVIGISDNPDYYQTLLPLLKDPDPGVRKSALRAAGQLDSPLLWPQVLESINSPEVRGAACLAMIAGGTKVLPEIEARFESPVIERASLARLVQTLGRIGGEQAVRLLRTKMDDPDPEVRTHVVRALSRSGYRSRVRQDGQVNGKSSPSAEEEKSLRSSIKTEAGLAAYLLATSADLEECREVEILRSALEAQTKGAVERIFYLLSFLYDPQSILRARDNLHLASGEKKAYALEVIEIQIPQELKALIFPLLEDLTVEQRLQRMNSFFPQRSLGQVDRLRELLGAADGRINPWIKACVLHVTGNLGLSALGDAVQEAMASPDPLIREEAARALHRFRGEGNMLTTIEKVIILKGVSIFEETPDETLGEVARVLEEVEVKAGETIFEKGDLGDSLYVMASGRVRVHDRGITLNELGEGDVFGEMALLDPEARVASVTAIEDTHLLRLDREPFYELMEDRIEVARGLILVLTRRLRARLSDVNELHARLESLSAQ